MTDQPIVKRRKNDSTIKIKSVTKEDELQYLQRKLNEAQVAMVNNYCQETRQAFDDANKAYFEANDLYTMAWRLLRARISTVMEAFSNLSMW